MKRFLILSCLAVAGCAGHSPSANLGDPNFFACEGEKAPNSYLVEIRANTPAVGRAIADQVVAQYKVEEQDYLEDLELLLANMPESTARAMSHDLRVASVSEDCIGQGATAHRK